MTPAQLAEALRVRRRREERALATLQQARAVETQAAAALAEARGALSAFDARLEAGLDAFRKRARMGVTPQGLTGMRAFHSDQLKAREGFQEPIAMAEGALALAQDRVAEARFLWQRATQAAGNLQEMGDGMTRAAARDRERRQEQDRDELAATRAARLAGEGRD